MERLIMPRYERPEDRKTQHAVACFLAEKWGVCAVPTPSDAFHVYDFALVRIDPVTLEHKIAVAEIKSYRDWCYGGNNFMTSNRKWESLLAVSEQKQIPAFLFVHDRETDLVRYVEVRPGVRHAVIENWGRSDRPNDPNARERAAVVYPCKFSTLGKLEKTRWV